MTSAVATPRTRGVSRVAKICAHAGRVTDHDAGVVPRDAATSSTSLPPSPDASLDSPARPSTPDEHDPPRRAASLARVPSRRALVVERVRDAIGPRRVDRSHWVPDANAPACANPACASEFTLINRRHHCRCCGDVFCRKCTATRLLLDPANGAPTRKVSSDAVQARVCLHCYERALDAAAEAEAAAVAEAAADTRCVATSPMRVATSPANARRLEDEDECAAKTKPKAPPSTTLASSDFLSARARIEAFARDSDAFVRAGKHRADLNDGGADLNDGGADLRDGGADLRDGGADLSDGADDLSDGADDLSDGGADGRSGVVVDPETTPERLPTTTPERPSGASRSDRSDAARVARETADLLARTPATPEQMSAAPNAELRHLVTRYTRQLREQARLTESYAAAAAEADARRDATERELALARAQVRRMGALWEELTEARKELDRSRQGRVVSGERTAAGWTGGDGALLARLDARWIDAEGSEKGSEKGANEPESNEPESNEPESPSGSWCSHLVWHDVDGDESAGVRSGVVFHRARNGAAARVAHGDVSEARVAFDEATGISSFILQMVDGRRVECRVTSAVAANRWAREIEERARAEREV